MEEHWLQFSNGGLTSQILVYSTANFQVNWCTSVFIMSNYNIKSLREAISRLTQKYSYLLWNS